MCPESAANPNRGSQTQTCLRHSLLTLPQPKLHSSTVDYYLISSLHNDGWVHFFWTHHSELLQFLVAFDEERTLLVSRPVAVAFASPTCSKGNKYTYLFTWEEIIMMWWVHSFSFWIKSRSNMGVKSYNLGKVTWRNAILSQDSHTGSWTLS